MFPNARFKNQNEKAFLLWPLLISGLAAALLFALLTLLNHYLISAAAPQGMISYELAGSFRKSLAILASWNAKARLVAAFSLGIDYLFLSAYSLFFALACFMLAAKFKESFARFYYLGLLLGWAQILAAALDAAENYALLRLLLGSQHHSFSWMAACCATIKFSLILAGVVYIFAALIFTLLNKYREKK